MAGAVACVRRNLPALSTSKPSPPDLLSCSGVRIAFFLGTRLYAFIKEIFFFAYWGGWSIFRNSDSVLYFASLGLTDWLPAYITDFVFAESQQSLERIVGKLFLRIFLPFRTFSLMLPCRGRKNLLVDSIPVFLRQDQELENIVGMVVAVQGSGV